MNKIKERLFGAITVMSDEEAMRLWNFVESLHLKNGWDAVDEAEPDEEDLAMLREIADDPQCREAASPEETARILEGR